MGLSFIVILVCQLSIEQCKLYQDHSGFRTGTECSRQLEKKMGQFRVQLPAPDDYRIVGWCGLPVSGMKQVG